MNGRVGILAAAAAIILANFQAAAGTSPAVAAEENPALSAIMQKLWAWRLSQRPLLAMQHDIPVTALPRDSWEAAEKKAAFASSILDQLAKLDAGRLSADEKIQIATIRFEMELIARSNEFYWHTITVTPYKTNFLTNDINPIFQRFQFATDADAERYLGLARDYAIIFEGVGARLKEQERRGILLAAPALPNAAALYRRLSESLIALLHVSDDRLSSIPEPSRAAFRHRLEATLTGRLKPALEAIADRLSSAEYKAKAPARVGVGAYPDGAAYYRQLILASTSLDLDPKDIHRIGLERMAALQERMAEVRRRVGFAGDAQAFRAFLKSSPQFRVSTPEALEKNYRACIDHMKPKLQAMFSRIPNAPYDVKRARPEAEAGMTFGYYGMPQAKGEAGYYFYNGTDLAAKPTFTNCAMIFHELAPGHHFHVASQHENEALPLLLRNNMSFGAYNEGWAEYAANLGVEAGAFTDPYSLYGRYLMESHVIARLVVDTGLNAFGWSSEKAAAYLRDNTLLSESEISSEILRYGTDLPGQALSYGIGYLTILRLREEAQRSLGQKFDLRAFHEAVLGGGGVPLPVLELRVRQMIAARRR